MKNEKIQKTVMTGVFAALSYVVFTFLQFKIPLPGGDATSIHLGNAVCVLGALILGGPLGGLGGAIGMTIGDLFDPVYVIYAPKTFLLKLCIGLLFNTVFDPLVGYLYKILILGKPAADVALAWNIASTSINTVLSAIVSVLVYLALLPALKKSGLFFRIGKEGTKA